MSFTCSLSLGALDLPAEIPIAKGRVHRRRLPECVWSSYVLDRHAGLVQHPPGAARDAPGVVEFGMAVQEAIEAPRVRVYRNRLVDVEGRVLDALAARGHETT